MKTNFRLSRKMHLFIIISCVVIALGIAVGTVCHFAAGGFYNYGADWQSKKSVTVTYRSVDYKSVDDVIKLCDDTFAADGLKAKKLVRMTNEEKTRGEVVYEFSNSTDTKKLFGAVEKIENKIKAEVASDGIRLSYASGSTGVTLPEGGKALWRGIIAAAVAIAVGFAYFLIRFKLSMALSTLLACAHNLALYLSVVALTRIPVGSSVVTFALLTVALTLFGCCVLFDRVRKNSKNEDLKKLSSFEIADRSANESFAVNMISSASLCAVALVLFVLMSVSSLSPLAIMSPAMLALACFVSCAYGTVFFTPAVFSRFNKISDDKRNKRKSVKTANK